MRIEPITKPQPLIYFRSKQRIAQQEKYINNNIVQKGVVGASLSSLFALLVYQFVNWHRNNYYKKDVEYKPIEDKDKKDEK